MAKRKLRILYKYPEQPWQIYDETFVAAWAEEQRQRAEFEHGRRGAEVKVVSEK